LDDIYFDGRPQPFGWGTRVFMYGRQQPKAASIESNANVREKEEGKEVRLRK
jgi:hypothetical protein